MEKQSIKELIGIVKKSKQEVPMQKVTKKEKPKEKEAQFSFFLSKKLLLKMKTKAINDEVSFKSIIIKSLEEYLQKD